MDWISEDNELIWRKINPIDNPATTSVLLIHGKTDVDVPWTQSESYVRAMKAKGVDVQTLWLPGTTIL